MKEKYLSTIFILMTVIPDLTAQGTYFEEGISIRNKEKGHYYKMVNWDDSPYQEFAWWEETEHGSIVDFMNWRAAFPQGYSKEDTLTRYPAIVVLHGAGESGRKWTNNFQYEPDDPEYDNNGHQLFLGGREHLNAVNAPVSDPRSFPGMMIFPQVSYNGAWTGDNVTKLYRVIEYMIREYHADPDRIYLHGLSNGAKGTWDVATTRPDLFAAILPMSGVGSDLATSTDVLVTTPVWLFQGGIDDNPSPEWTEQWVNALREKGGNPRYTVYPDKDHTTWLSAYAEPDFFSWMLQSDKKEIYVFDDSSEACVTQEHPWRLGISGGYLAYQWTLNDEEIPGAIDRYYSATEGGTYSVKFKRRTDSLWAQSYPVTLGDGSAPVLSASNSISLPVPDGWEKRLDLVAPPGFPQYEWYREDALLATTSEPFYTLNDKEGELFQPADTGTYTVRIPVDAGCPFDPSNPVEVTYSENEPTAEPPANVQTSASSSSEVQLSWTDTDYETYYEIWQRRVNTLSGDRQNAPGYPATDYAFRGTNGPNVTSFADQGLRPGAEYVYKVRAIHPDGGGVFSEETQVTRTADDVTPPSTPTSLAAYNVTPASARLTWHPSADDDVVYKYEVFNNDVLTAEVKADTADSDPTDGNPYPPLTYIVTGLNPAKASVLKVRAVDYSGNPSAFSNTVHIERLLDAETVEKEMLSIYPNPFRDQVTIESEHLSASKQRLVLYGMTSAYMYDQTLNFKDGKALIDLQHLPEGIYILQLGTKRYKLYKKD